MYIDNSKVVKKLVLFQGGNPDFIPQTFDCYPIDSKGLAVHCQTPVGNENKYGTQIFVRRFFAKVYSKVHSLSRALEARGEAWESLRWLPLTLLPFAQWRGNIGFHIKRKKSETP